MSITELVQIFRGEAAKAAPAEPKVDYWQPGNIYALADGNYVMLTELDFDCEVLVFKYENQSTQTGSYSYWRWRGIQLVEVA